MLAIIIFSAWEADRRDRAQLAGQFAAAQKTISQAAASQHDRDILLNQTLAQIAAQKQAAVTPAQILKALPSIIPLPVPIAPQSHPAPPAQGTLGESAATSTGSADKSAPNGPLPGNPTPKPAQLSDTILPAADLKPLYDFALDCKACQARLQAAQGDLQDEKAKTLALTRQRDDAVRAAKGGSALRRIALAAKWFVLGAAAGAIAAKA
ncbi:MAG TPA: hypothetical protein VEU31_02135, partial [Candidatus Acidoferrales bacterium]|nr:hypothetical protein [Candidatus Acidoferrales bacterium]